MNKKKLLPLMEKWKLPMLILLAGLVLMLFPSEPKPEEGGFEPQNALTLSALSAHILVLVQIRSPY